MILASNICGTSIIRNVAREPHVTDLAKTLIKMGAKTQGVDTNMLTIPGKEKLSGFEHSIVPGHIQAGIFAIATGTTEGRLIIHNAIQEHSHSISRMLNSLNFNFKFLDSKTLDILDSCLQVNEQNLQVGLWPNFPTDLMSPAIVQPGYQRWYCPGNYCIGNQWRINTR